MQNTQHLTTEKYVMQRIEIELREACRDRRRAAARSRATCLVGLAAAPLVILIGKLSPYWILLATSLLNRPW